MFKKVMYEDNIFGLGEGEENNGAVDQFNSILDNLNKRVNSVSESNLHQWMPATRYSGIIEVEGKIMENLSFYNEYFLFIKVLFKPYWGSFHYVPAEQHNSYGYFTGSPGTQLKIKDPPTVKLLASAYCFIGTDGSVGLCSPSPVKYGEKEPVLPDRIFLYAFYDNKVK